MNIRYSILPYVVAIALSATGVAFGQPKSATGKAIMIAAHPDAAKAGLDIWHKGGNVVDVAVATAYSLGVVEPHGSGIGGEGMMLIYEAATGKATVIDFKGISPTGANYRTLDLSNAGAWARSGKAAAIPGVVAGLELARERFGRLDRASLLQPAIDYALKGFVVDSTLALNLAAYQRILSRDSSAARTFYRGGAPVRRGEVVRNPEYGQTLQLIQREGASAFYRGTIAEMIVRDAGRSGGFITREDLQAYQPLVREAVRGEYRGYQVITTPPPCGGIFLIEGLNILKHFDLRTCRAESGYDAHLLAEVFKLIYRDERTFNGDPAFATVPVDSLISEAFALWRLGQISLDKARPSSKLRSAPVTQPNTTHLSVMDSKGNAVALTVTLSSLFGTAHTVAGAGFLLNNELQNFDTIAAHPNGLAPHKRVVTSLVPTVLRKEGKAVLVMGTPGGDLIISTILQVLVNSIDHGEDLRGAVDAPRLFSIHSQDEVEMEGRFDPETEMLLRRLGHIVKVDPPYRSYYGAVQAISRDLRTGILTGVSDPRRSGAAVGE
jgi:gamma-glutamyltranspeptidase/glutathione hydrolase